MHLPALLKLRVGVFHGGMPHVRVQDAVYVEMPIVHPFKQCRSVQHATHFEQDLVVQKSSKTIASSTAKPIVVNNSFDWDCELTATITTP